VRMPDWYPNFPYQWVSWSNWLSAVDTQVASVKSSGASNISAWELWNEPDWTWNTSAAGSFDSGWATTFKEVRSKDSSRPIQGPSISHWDQAWMKTFLTDAKAGGTLLAGLDPTGIGGTVAGFGDQRELELLVEAGFTPLEAIKIASLNGAQFLGEADKIGSLAAGKQADIMLVKGDPSTRIDDIENVELVFKDGVGWDSKKLIESVKGQVGTR